MDSNLCAYAAAIETTIFGVSLATARANRCSLKRENLLKTDHNCGKTAHLVHEHRSKAAAFHLLVCNLIFNMRIKTSQTIRSSSVNCSFYNFTIICILKEVRVVHLAKKRQQTRDVGSMPKVTCNYLQQESRRVVSSFAGISHKPFLMTLSIEGCVRW
jgi:hypothetical protein